jgi:hypothetical protein
MLHHAISNKPTDVSYVLIYSIIALMVKKVSTYETSISTRLHGATSQKTNHLNLPIILNGVYPCKIHVISFEFPGLSLFTNWSTFIFNDWLP